MMQSDQQINEGLNHNDLKGLISSEISIDQFKSKLGKDENVIVIALKIKDRDPAHDLSQFIESGYTLLDVDTSPGPDDEGNYTVFVEINRDSNAFNFIETMLSDVQHVDNNISNWTFKSYENKEVSEFNENNFSEGVITDSYQYVIKHNPEAKEIGDRMKFLNNY